MNTYLSDAANVHPPTEGQNVVLATSGTAVRVEIPVAWRSKWISITALTADLVFLLGDSAVDVVWADVNTVSTEVISNKDTVGRIIPAGQTVEYRFPEPEASYTNAAGAVAKITHMVFEAAGAGHIGMSPSHRRS